MVLFEFPFNFVINAHKNLIYTKFVALKKSGKFDFGTHLKYDCLQGKSIFSTFCKNLISI